jgi:hypothetical protein
MNPEDSVAGDRDFWMILKTCVKRIKEICIHKNVKYKLRTNSIIS